MPAAVALAARCHASSRRNAASLRCTTVATRGHRTENSLERFIQCRDVRRITIVRSPKPFHVSIRYNMLRKRGRPRKRYALVLLQRYHASPTASASSTKDSAALHAPRAENSRPPDINGMGRRRRAGEGAARQEQLAGAAARYIRALYLQVPRDGSAGSRSRERQPTP